MGLLDMLNADPTSPQGMQLQGLLGGLISAGAALSQAGQFRPVGTPAPSLGDALGAFGTGRRGAMMNAYQTAEMEKRQRRAGLLGNALSDKPDEELTPQERSMRETFDSLPPHLRPLMSTLDPEQAVGMVFDREKGRVVPVDAARAQAMGLRPGTVAFENAWTGAPTVLQQPDYKSPEAEAQAIRIANASRGPQAPIVLGPGQTAFDPRTGKPIAAGNAEDVPLNEPQAWNTVMRLAELVAEGKIDPNSPEGRRYTASHFLLSQPKPLDVEQPDGTVRREYAQRTIPFPALTGRPAEGGQGGAAPAGDGTTIKQAKPLTESQGNATMYLQRMQEAEKRLAAVTGGGYSPGNLRDSWLGALPGVGNFAISEQGQNYRQAQEDWVRAKLRKESGAVIAKEEMAAEIKTYFPQPGDSPSTIAQKAAARQTAMDALSASAGPGVGRMTTTAPAGGQTPRDPLGILK